MDKKPLIGVSICAVVLLVLGSMNTVAGYQTIKTSQKNLLKERINQRLTLQNNYHFGKIMSVSPILYLLFCLIMGSLLIISMPVALFSGLIFLFCISIIDKCKDLGMDFNNSIFYRFMYAISIIPLAILLITGIYLFYVFSFIAAVIILIFGLFPYSLLIGVNKIINRVREKSVRCLVNGFG